MTIFELEDALVEFIAANTAEMRFRSNEQTYDVIPPQVYSGFVPRDEVGGVIPGEITVYPAIIVCAQTGAQDLDCETVTVQITIGCFDAELDQQGYRDCCNIIQRLKDRFRETDIIREKFALSKERFLLNWQMNKRYGGAFPYFFAEMQVNFELPVFSNQFDLGAWDGDVTPGRYNQTPIPTPPPLEHDKHPVPPPIKFEEIFELPTGGIAKEIGAISVEPAVALNLTPFTNLGEAETPEKEPLRLHLMEAIEMGDHA